jgi:hypothetical protein
LSFELLEIARNGGLLLLLRVLLRNRLVGVGGEIAEKLVFLLGEGEIVVLEREVAHIYKLVYIILRNSNSI